MLLALGVAVLLLQGQAPSPAPDRKPSVALTAFCTSTIEPGFYQSLQTRFGTLLGKGGLNVITPGDLSAVLGLERQKQLLGCSQEASCLAELGGAMGVEALVSGCVVKGSGGYTATVRAVSTKDARPIAAYSERTPTDEALQDWLDQQASLIAKDLRQSMGLAELVAAPQRKGRPVTIALGVASLLGLGGGIALGVLAQGSSDKLLGAVHPRPEATTLATSARSLGLGATVSYAAAGLCAAVALVFFFVEPGLRGAVSERSAPLDALAAAFGPFGGVP